MFVAVSSTPEEGKSVVCGLFSTRLGLLRLILRFKPLRGGGVVESSVGAIATDAL